MYGKIIEHFEGERECMTHSFIIPLVHLKSLVIPLFHLNKKIIIIRIGNDKKTLLLFFCTGATAISQFPRKGWGSGE